MSKYWNPRRVRRVRERKERKENAVLQREKDAMYRSRTYSTGDAHKNIRIMLDALGVPLRRKMLARLAASGAMSLSKLVEPFHVFLPPALVQLRILERAGLVRTRKQGRTRMCFLRPGAFRELSEWLRSPDIIKRLD